MLREFIASLVLLFGDEFLLSDIRTSSDRTFRVQSCYACVQFADLNVWWCVHSRWWCDSCSCCCFCCCFDLLPVFIQFLFDFLRWSRLEWSSDILIIRVEGLIDSMIIGIELNVAFAIAIEILIVFRVRCAELMVLLLLRFNLRRSSMKCRLSTFTTRRNFARFSEFIRTSILLVSHNILAIRCNRFLQKDCVSVQTIFH